MPLLKDKKLLIIFAVFSLVIASPFLKKSYFENTNHEISFNREKAKPLKYFSSGRMPASLSDTRGLNVVINAGDIAYLDEDTNIDTLTIYGELHCDELNANPEIELRVKTIFVNGVFQCGTASNPYNKKLIISLKDSEIDPKQDPAYRGIVVGMGGKLILNGDRKNSGWYKLNHTLNAGDDSLFVRYGLQATSSSNQVVRSPASVISRTIPWSIGDTIVVAPTGFNHEEAEHFTITGIDPNTNEIFLDHPAEFTHWGQGQIFNSKALGSFELDERAEIANLTRSILIRADETDGEIDEGTGVEAQRGGHIMVHHNGKAYIDSVELYKMGQAGVMARYPFHWHYSGDVPGQFIKNSSIHHSYQRCVTVHRTNQSLVQNNVCYNFKGHGYFLEDGNEVNNTVTKNLAIKAMPPSSNKLLLQSDNINRDETQGRFPSVSCFWISNPKNTITHNTAAGCRGVGFWMSFETEVKDFNGNIVARPISEITTAFNDNTAHSTRVGITWDGAPAQWMGNANNPNNPNDFFITSAHYEPTVMPTFHRLRAYKNSMTGIYFRGNTVIFKNTITADNGWSYWLSYNSIMKDSVFIGETQNKNSVMDEFYYQMSFNNGRNRKTGIVLYDGPFEIHNSDFLDYSTQPRNYTLSDGTIVPATVIPFITTGGTNKFTNYVNGIRFNPEPYYRAHLEDPSENMRGIQYLGNFVLRDLDGSLTNSEPGSIIVGVRSMGASAQSGCVSGGEKFYNMKICPPNYAEGSITYMRWGGGGAPWGTPFLVRRSDGQYTYEKDEWNQLTGWNHPNNLFALANHQGVSYELLPLHKYTTDVLVGTKAHMDANFEQSGVNSPVIKIVAYGTNCRLESGENAPVEAASSLADLKTRTTTSYYSNGEDFYVRVIPKTWWDPITPNAQVQSTAYTTMPTRHGIVCDNSAIPKRVVGSITNVKRGNSQTEISGWACNYTHHSPIKVNLYALGPAVKTHSAIARKDVYTFIKQITSSATSTDKNIAYNCGRLSSAGRHFTFSIPNRDLAKFNKHKVYIKGLSNTSGADVYLTNSGRFSFHPTNTDSTK
jgi:cell migration-inducing and hyaluronan-binding protein